MHFHIKYGFVPQLFEDLCSHVYLLTCFRVSLRLRFHVCELFIRRTLVVRMKCRTEKSVSMIRIFIRFSLLFHVRKNRITRAKKQTEVSKFVHVVRDLRNMAMCRRNLQLKLSKAMVEEDVFNELYGVIIMRKIQLSK